MRPVSSDTPAARTAQHRSTVLALLTNTLMSTLQLPWGIPACPCSDEEPHHRPNQCDTCCHMTVLGTRTIPPLNIQLTVITGRSPASATHHSVGKAPSHAQYSGPSILPASPKQYYAAYHMQRLLARMRLPATPQAHPSTCYLLQSATGHTYPDAYAWRSPSSLQRPVPLLATTTRHATGTSTPRPCCRPSNTGHSMTPLLRAGANGHTRTAPISCFPCVPSTSAGTHYS